MRMNTFGILGGCIALGAILAIPAAAQTQKACSVSSADGGPPAGCQDLWSTAVEMAVPHGAYVHVPNPGCMNDATGAIAQMHQAAISLAYPKLAVFAGPISRITGSAVNQYFLNNGGGDFGKLFSPYAKNGALCAPLVAIIPVNSQYVGFRLLATDGANANVLKGCPGSGGDCAIGWSAFQSAPVTTAGQAMRTVSVIFMNWSHDRDRRVRMLVFFKMPNGESPGIEL